MLAQFNELAHDMNHFLLRSLYLKLSFSPVIFKGNSHE